MFIPLTPPFYLQPSRRDKDCVLGNIAGIKKPALNRFFTNARLKWYELANQTLLFRFRSSDSFNNSGIFALLSLFHGNKFSRTGISADFSTSHNNFLVIDRLEPIAIKQRPMPCLGNSGHCSATRKMQARTAGKLISTSFQVKEAA